MKVSDVDDIPAGENFVQTIQDQFEEYIEKIEAATLAMMKIAMISVMVASGVTEVKISDSAVDSYDSDDLDADFDPETGVTTFRLVGGA